VNNQGGAQTRTFNVNTTQGSAIFSGVLSNSNTTTFNKTGLGTLLLSGTNTLTNTTTFGLSAGVLQINAAASLGSGAISFGGGVLQVNTTAPVLLGGSILMTAVGGVDVVSGGSVTLSNPVLGAFSLTKTGPGSLILTGTASTNSSMVIGGAPLATAANQTSGVSGGTVSTTATGGNVFGTGTITVNGGVLSLVGGSTAQAISVGTLNFGGGSYIQLNAATTSSKLTVATLTRNNLGTLTLLSGTLVNVGSIETLALGGTSSYLNTGSMLTTPNVYIRLAGTGQDAEFAQLGSLSGTWGFKAQTALTTNTLSASGTLSVGTIATSGTVGAGTISLLALKVSGSTISSGTASLRARSSVRHLDNFG
ncbi:MAG: hypothetical protein EBR81_10890, partial [Proteobacteria bacterium]|nr:hypothetical protein [Pseudomonadota bacterium]